MFVKIFLIYSCMKVFEEIGGRLFNQSVSTLQPDFKTYNYVDQQPA